MNLLCIWNIKPLSTIPLANIFSHLVGCLFVLGWVVFFIIFFWLCHLTCGISIPWPRIESRPSAMRVLSPNHWTAREFPISCPFVFVSGFPCCVKVLRLIGSYLFILLLFPFSEKIDPIRRLIVRDCCACVFF